MQCKHLMVATAAIAAVLTSSRIAGAGESVESLIKRQSQEFSDASASGDAKVLGKYLDDHVVFMNETGLLATKQDIVSSAAPKPKGVSQKLVQTHFAVQIHNNVAVTSFTDESTVEFHGQTLRATYRSTEVWMKQQAGWRMISSQTIAIADDPPAIKLQSKVLGEYVGTYKADDDFVFRIARSGDDLTGAVNGGTPYPIKAELVDVLFTPGQPTMRRLVQRDTKGKITGMLVRRDGHDLVLTRVG